MLFEAVRRHGTGITVVPTPMPLTFPSHAAAVWPLHRVAPRVLPAAALIVGSCTPDFAYLIGLNGLFTHSWKGTVFFSLPSGLLALAWLELCSSLLHPAMPSLFGRPLGAFLRTWFFPRSPRQWAQTLLALWLGALTHLLWDGFTHRTRWPANVLYPKQRVELPLGWGEMPLANVFQHASTVVGIGLMALWLVRARPALSAEAADTDRRAQITLLLASALGAALSVQLAERATANIWELFWACARGMLLGVTAWCAFRARRRPATENLQP